MDKEESTFSCSDIHKLTQSYSQDIKPQVKHSTPTPALSQGFLMSKMWYSGNTCTLPVIIATLALAVAFANFMITQRDIQRLQYISRCECKSSDFNGGGVVFTKWGSSSCPNAVGTELVYSGIMGVSKVGVSCMPQDPDYTLGEDFIYRDPNRYGVISEGRYGTQNLSQCAVCMATTRKTVLTVPAKTNCPSSWIREYYGYFMLSFTPYQVTMPVCFDQAASPDNNPYDYNFVHTESSCDINNGLPCPPYNSTKVVNCVVCTK